MQISFISNRSLLLQYTFILRIALNAIKAIFAECICSANITETVFSLLQLLKAARGYCLLCSRLNVPDVVAF